jgi:retron-type reverse transcriptase
VDRMCVERFAAQEGRYLQALHEHLRDGSYQPHPVKRVEIPEGTARPVRWGSPR